MPCEYFLLIRRQRRPCLLAIDDGLSLAGQHAGRDYYYYYYYVVVHSILGGLTWRSGSVVRRMNEVTPR